MLLLMNNENHICLIYYNGEIILVKKVARIILFT